MMRVALRREAIEHHSAVDLKDPAARGRPDYIDRHKPCAYSAHGLPGDDRQFVTDLQRLLNHWLCAMLEVVPPFSLVSQFLAEEEQRLFIEHNDTVLGHDGLEGAHRESGIA
jgi:hypothetical protein